VTAACEGRRVHVARVTAPAEWRAIVVLPTEPLATSKARAVLPSSYSRADVVTNIQSAALLGLAFAEGRGIYCASRCGIAFINPTGRRSARNCRGCCLWRERTAFWERR